MSSSISVKGIRLSWPFLVLLSEDLGPALSYLMKKLLSIDEISCWLFAFEMKVDTSEAVQVYEFQRAIHLVPKS